MTASSDKFHRQRTIKDLAAYDRLIAQRNLRDDVLFTLLDHLKGHWIIILDISLDHFRLDATVLVMNDELGLGRPALNSYCEGVKQ